jgi:hypothetical protein
MEAATKLGAGAEPIESTGQAPLLSTELDRRYRTSRLHQR